MKRAASEDFSVIPYGRVDDESFTVKYTDDPDILPKAKKNSNGGFNYYLENPHASRAILGMEGDDSHKGWRWEYPKSLAKKMDAWELERSRKGFKKRNYANTYSTMPALPPKAKRAVDEETGQITYFADKFKKARARRAKNSWKKMPRRRYYRRKRRYYGKRRYGRRYGRGDYTMNPNDSIGRRWGGYLGSKAGEYIGGWAGRAIGLGSYTIRKNVLTGRLPEITNISTNGGTVIRFQEYLGDIITSSTAGNFKSQVFKLNPANNTTFPWLSQIAENYEQGEIEGMLFEFKSTSANALNSTNTALGSVMFATQYDVNDADFSNKGEMLNYEFSTSCVPSSDQTHMIECEPGQTPITLLYNTGDDNAPPNTDAKFYFLGKTTIATVGFQGTNVNIGELYVTYQVRLLKPKLQTILGTDISYLFSYGTDYTNATPLPSIPTTINSSGDITLTNNAQIQFPASIVPKKYLIYLRWQGSGAVVCVLPTVSFLLSNGDPSNASLINTIPLSNNTTNGGVSAAACDLNYAVNVPANAQRTVLTFSATGTLPTTPTTIQCRVLEMPSNY